VMSNLGM
jgi:hypothetical protein